jgi:hypothetical protein
MRCTRCDRIAVPQAVGLDRDGRVVFGWCLSCLVEEECLLVEVPGNWLDPSNVLPGVRPAFLKRRPRRLDRRAWAVTGVAGLMAVWALILAALGLWRLPVRAEGTSPLGNGSARLLLAGGGVMAAISLAVWATVLNRSRLLRTMLVFVKVTATVLGFATLVWGVVRHDPHRNDAVIVVAALAFALAWTAHWYERRSRRVSSFSTTDSPRARGVVVNLGDDEFEVI